MLRWPIYIFNVVDITKLPCYHHRRSTTVSLETFTLYSFNNPSRRSVQFSSVAAARWKLCEYLSCENKVNFCAVKVHTFFKLIISRIQTLSWLGHVFTWFCLLVDQSPDFYWNLQIFLHQSPDFRCFEVERSEYLENVSSFSESSRVFCMEGNTGQNCH